EPFGRPPAVPCAPVTPQSRPRCDAVGDPGWPNGASPCPERAFSTSPGLVRCNGGCPAAPRQRREKGGHSNRSSQMSRHRIHPLARALLAGACLATPAFALAATYTVGPSGRQYTQLSTLVSNVNLEPGDVVLVDGGRTYSGNIVVGSNDSGAPGNPVTFRWNRAVGSSRPVLSGGSHTIKFQQSNHVVFEGFEVTGGTSSCIFSEAHDVT